MEYNFSPPPLEKLPITVVRNSILSPGKLRGVDDLEVPKRINEILMQGSWKQDRKFPSTIRRLEGELSVMKGLNVPRLALSETFSEP